MFVDDQLVVTTFDDCYNLDMTLSRIIIPALKKFREVVDSHPDTLTFEQWKGVLNTMIAGFEETLKDLPDEKKVEKGLHLFSKHYSHLWM